MGCKGRWEGGGHVAPRTGDEGSPQGGRERALALALALLSTFLPLQIQVRKAAVAYEVRALLLGAEGSADSALRGLCLGVCGAWAGLSKLRGPPVTARFLPAV